MDPYLHFWGKAGNGLVYHPVAFHGLDVAAAGRQLLAVSPEVRCRLARLCGLAEEPLVDWITFLLALHDIGKLADSFQALRADLMLHLQQRTARLDYGERHDALGWRLWSQGLFARLAEERFLGLEPAGREMWSDLLAPWLHAVMGHHGRPVKLNDKEVFARLFPAPVEEASLLLVRSLAELLLPGGIPFDLQDFDDREDRFKTASWLVAGVAVAADWMGSNSTWFGFHPEPLSLAEYWQTVATPKAAVAIRESGLISARASTFRGLGALWPSLQAPTPLQDLAGSIEMEEGPSLFIIEEVTGGGKTEAALALTHRLMEQRAASGFYFGLPTMATANAMYGRVEPIYRRFFRDGEEPWLALAHSRRDLFLERTSLETPPPDQPYAPGEATASLDCAAWLADSRKKALLAHVAVGTIDQALIGVLPLRHQSLRLLGLAGKVLIVDEVHACDDYVRKLLATLLRFHGAFGGSAILLSATLPESQRAELLAAFAQGAGWRCPAVEKGDYPLVSRLSRSGLAEIPVAARAAASRRVEVVPLRDRGQVEERILATLEAGGCVAWIRNTVGDANEAYAHWRERLGADRVMLFHSRFTVGDRASIEQEVLRRFGPESTAADRRGRLLVATQVIEQSLDLDFEFLVVDLCPIDLVVQRAGRLRRHLRTLAGDRCGGPDGRGPAVLGLFSPEPIPDPEAGWYSEVFPGAAWVYEHPGRLWLTARWLEDHGGFRMPEDARELIEWVYGPESETRIPEGLRTGSNRAEGKEAGDKSFALINRLKLETGYKATSLDWPDDARTPTRLGEPTVTLRLVRTTPGGYEPWHNEGPRPWQLSEVTVPRSKVEAEDPELAENLLAALRARMPDQGRYSVIAVLSKTDGYYRGFVRGSKARTEIRYSTNVGAQLLGVLG